ncbi:sigma-70 family RNA polymerase sigma factor [bacterium]|jgi:RNA polymerase sigma-70 factor (ECF subfamily)|nr:sigma-70 family RNA polymerase sigma factor [bacterium]
MADISNTVNIEDIFRKYNRRIYALALSIIKDAKEAEDIVQDVFLKIIRKIDTFKGKSDISTWIYRITYNEALTHLREKTKLRSINYADDNQHGITKNSEGLSVNWPLMPDELSEQNELKESIDKAIARLPIKYRVILLLRSVEGFSVKETAGILKIKENSVKSRLHRARLIIHKELSNHIKTSRPESPEKEDVSCDINTRFIYDYIEGHMDATKGRAFKKHIADCRECNGFLDTYMKAIAITNALQCADIPNSLQDRIKTFIALNS